MALGLTNKDYIGKLSGCGFVVINMVVLFIIKGSCMGSSLQPVVAKWELFHLHLQAFKCAQILLDS